MQKSEKKLNASAVGATSSRPHFEGMAKENKGITLIALIITIIVMLILVGVIINVAINGGLFNTASDATRDTEMNGIYDQILGAMKLTDSGNVNVKETYDEVVKIFGNDKVTPTNPTTGGEITTEVTFTVTGKRGTYTYKITTTEIIKNPKKINYLEFESGKTYGAFKVNSSFAVTSEELKGFGYEVFDSKENINTIKNEVEIESTEPQGFLEFYVEYDDNGVYYLELNIGVVEGETEIVSDYIFAPELLTMNGEILSESGWYIDVGENYKVATEGDFVLLNGSWTIPESLDNEDITIINNTFGKLFILEN